MEEQPQEPQQAVPSSNPDVNTKKSSEDGKVVTFRILSIVGIVVGIVGGFLVGAFINFGACYKSQCSAFEQNAAILLPLGSLVITVPLTVKAFTMPLSKKSDPPVA